MGIKKSVGEGAINDKVDVKIIQASLNLVQADNFKLDKLLVIDGAIGNKTITEITNYQVSVLHFSNPDGRVDPGGKTLRSLSNHIQKELNIHSLMAIMSYGSETRISQYLYLIRSSLPRYQINTPLRIAHLLAQLGHESLSFKYTEEIASGAAYEGRDDLGNTHTGDGVRFKGRGLIQLTGRSNYETYGNYVGIDLLKKANEKKVADEAFYALDVGLWFWDKRKLNAKADADNLRSITRTINGGYNGLDDREDYLNRAKYFLVE